MVVGPSSIFASADHQVAFVNFFAPNGIGNRIARTGRNLEGVWDSVGALSEKPRRVAWPRLIDLIDTFKTDWCHRC